MKAEKRNWLATFLAGFLATALGILITFGIDSMVSSSKRAKTANLLARHIVGNMDRTYHELREYQDLYDTIDSTSMILHLAIMADTLERVSDDIVVSFLNLSLSEYVQADIDNGIDAYKAEILSTIGNVELIGHIDQFYSYARQHAAVSSQVIDQKRVVADNVYAHFYGDLNATDRDYVLYLHELTEFNVFYSRMQNVRASLQQIEEAMSKELSACKQILDIQ
ncbi:MAG: hypothetical protein IJ795_02485 [Bacteroidales bacterium]|nr:hypothetical protein [Bacteroidales bacterium]